ncbi:hypothetical protein P154DRAFT_577544 [Amniculicola lignicola CBS 123094]|uniref:Uncharacterized protein n=1 Tax=Amniculicola lignicola CBS 123094 TaxID=1392246 RepID=A0A6A5WDQ6_9PLEO|nr:hypothetical protein P154DRAFT_577544 [Amniculicola lignicola CBS 123094]
MHPRARDKNGHNKHLQGGLTCIRYLFGSTGLEMYNAALQWRLRPTLALTKEFGVCCGSQARRSGEFSTLAFSTSNSAVLSRFEPKYSCPCKLDASDAITPYPASITVSWLTPVVLFHPLQRNPDRGCTAHTPVVVSTRRTALLYHITCAATADMCNAQRMSHVAHDYAVSRSPAALGSLSTHFAA